LLAGGSLLTYVLTIFVLIVIPGPSVLFVVSRGVALAIIISLGLGSIVARSVAVFTVIKLAGAAYMVFLGARMFRDRHALARMLDAAVAPKGMRRMLREGFVVGVTNPKAVILMTAVLPQFIDRSAGHVQLQFLLLGAISLIVGLFSDGAWAILSGTARVWLARSPRRLELLGGAGGLVLVGLGVRLALTGRKD
jgi:threonine/homoserine/homoserine lactone efflux protein